MDYDFRTTGENSHYGTPTNPAMPSYVPGGSSSGSAVAVAAELVDFAIGILLSYVKMQNSTYSNLTTGFLSVLFMPSINFSICLLLNSKVLIQLEELESQPHFVASLDSGLHMELYPQLGFSLIHRV